MLKKVIKNIKGKLGLLPNKDQSYYNPIENQEYHINGGFVSYRNGKKVQSPLTNAKGTKLESVVLLTPEEEMKQSISTEELAGHIQMINSVFGELFVDAKESGKILVQVELDTKDKGNRVEYASKGDVNLKLLAEFERRISAKTFSNSQRYPIKVHLLFKVNSFDEEL